MAQTHGATINAIEDNSLSILPDEAGLRGVKSAPMALRSPVRWIFLGLAFFVAGCATTRHLPEYERPLKHSLFMKVRTTAYTHTETDHLRYSNYNAVGNALSSAGLSGIRSAAADWARFPLGTQFLILSTGQAYEVDDYGWALSGRNTIDLYCPTRGEMNAWGVRRVTIQVLHWGDPWRSYRVLKPRANHAHVQRMLWEIRKFY